MSKHGSPATKGESSPTQDTGVQTWGRERLGYGAGLGVFNECSGGTFVNWAAEGGEQTVELVSGRE